ncbi:hypothetical protein TMatcc_007909 [Talaromyces marneffei ATCC 18224]
MARMSLAAPGEIYEGIWKFPAAIFLNNAGIYICLDNTASVSLSGLIIDVTIAVIGWTTGTLSWCSRTNQFKLNIVRTIERF